MHPRWGWGRKRRLPPLRKDFIVLEVSRQHLAVVNDSEGRFRPYKRHFLSVSLVLTRKQRTCVVFLGAMRGGINYRKRCLQLRIVCLKCQCLFRLFPLNEPVFKCLKDVRRIEITIARLLVCEKE
ncbi:hypothetical protein AVEN_71276-1 [Araneus ventricosus]|uniref:Uncharacterized protein n=1 Tax=Araneus ventricosus TaxID=182803 RepID=A0A4Y2SWJ6_ARAVE|nr:hypothetical protein AVEN_71276-1 [Araneus ventricosus]